MCSINAFPDRSCSFAFVRDMPYVSAAVIGNEHASVVPNGDTDRPAPHAVVIRIAPDPEQRTRMMQRKESSHSRLLIV